MNELILNHEFTPPFLKAVNAELTACMSLENEEFSTERFKHLSFIRHKIILRELARLSESKRKAFAAKEVIVNEKLEALARDLLNYAKEEAVNFSRSRTAVKKYK